MTPLRFRKKTVRLSVGARTDVGKARSNNEDRFLLADLNPHASSRGPMFNGQPIGPLGALLAVADGMGGASGGEVASQMAAQILLDGMLETWGSETRATAAHFRSCLTSTIETANDRIHRRSVEDPDLQGMGTTLTAVGILGRELVFAQVGDSRGYLIRQESAEQVTIDQSLMHHLVATGQLSEDEARNTPERNMVLQALGPSPTVDVEITNREARRGDTLVLCTDGLSGVVARDEIWDAVHRSHDPSTACDDLIDLANSRGGPDNVTVIVARLDGPGLRVP